MENEVTGKICCFLIANAERRVTHTWAMFALVIIRDRSKTLLPIPP